MKFRAIVLFLLLALAATAWVIWPRGYSEVVITDFSKPVHMSAQAPFLPFRQGLMYVVIAGKIEGRGKLVICENSSSESETIPVFGPRVYYISGGAENWSDSVRVTFMPENIQAGTLSIRLYCGAYPKPLDINAEQGGAASLAPLGADQGRFLK
jgi:hypothetical protein